MMSRVLAAAVSCAVGLAAVSTADALELTVDPGDADLHEEPIAVQLDAAPTGRVQLRDGDGAAHPATVHEGVLYFVPSRIPAGPAAEFAIEAADEDGAPGVVVREAESGHALEVHIRGEHFTTFHHDPANKKPFLWPLNAEGGIGITRDWPMGEIETRLGQDHPHQKSFWTAWGDVNGEDLWAEGGNSGAQEVAAVRHGSGDAMGWISADLIWRGRDGEALLSERRLYRFYNTPASHRLFDVHVRLDATHGDVRINDTKEGGLVAARMRVELSYRNGVITNAHGDVGEANLWGKPAPWCDYSGELEGIGWRGLALMDHPGNFRHPTAWHVRMYGLMGANAFGYSYFRERDYAADLPERGDHVISSGESLTMNYRAYVHSGNVEDADVAGRFARYANPPRVCLVE